MQLSSCWWLAREKAMITRSTSHSSRTLSSWSSEPSFGRRWAPFEGVDVVVDDADRLEAELAVALEALGEAVGDERRSRRSRCAGAAAPAVGDSRGPAPGRRCRSRRWRRWRPGRPGPARRASSAAATPSTGQDSSSAATSGPRRVVEAAGPGPEVAVAVEAEDEGEDDRADHQHRGQDQASVDGDGEDQGGEQAAERRRRRGRRRAAGGAGRSSARSPREARTRTGPTLRRPPRADS